MPAPSKQQVVFCIDQTTAHRQPLIKSLSTRLKNKGLRNRTRIKVYAIEKVHLTWLAAPILFRLTQVRQVFRFIRVSQHKHQQREKHGETKHTENGTKRGLQNEKAPGIIRTATGNESVNNSLKGGKCFLCPLTVLTIDPTERKPQRNY